MQNNSFSYLEKIRQGKMPVYKSFGSHYFYSEKRSAWKSNQINKESSMFIFDLFDLTTTKRIFWHMNSNEFRDNKKFGRWVKREFKEFSVQQIGVTQSPFFSPGPFSLSFFRPLPCVSYTQKICLLECPIKDTEIRARKWMPLKVLFTHFRHRVRLRIDSI